MLTKPRSAPRLCELCPLRRVGMDLVTDLQPENGAIKPFRLARGQVFSAEDLSDRFLMVRDGSLKVEYLNRDGCPEIASFLFAGDPVISTFSEEPVAVTALEDTWLCDLDPERVHCIPERTGPVLRELWHAIGVQASSDQHRLILARTGTIEQRIWWFLCDMAERQNSRYVQLSMSRDDIAHYLETTSESISRAISDLHRRGTIVREKPRRIRLVG